MELRDALEQISAIREHVARTETFRGYRSQVVAFSALVAACTAGLQAAWLPEPRQAPQQWLALWIAAACVCVAVTGWEMTIRHRRSSSDHARRLTWLAIEQFLPCLIAGALVTAALARFAPEKLDLLPGLWAILFGLGVFASHRLLPRATFWVGAYYLLAGAMTLALAREERAFSPWAMLGCFGVGQTAAAGVLYWFLERRDG